MPGVAVPPTVYGTDTGKLDADDSVAAIVAVPIPSGSPSAGWLRDTKRPPTAVFARAFWQSTGYHGKGESFSALNVY